MSELLDLLGRAVSARSRRVDVALLLSAGIDSLSVGLALDRAGKSVHAYTFYIEGLPSGDIGKARKIAGRFGWRMSVITVPTSGLVHAFQRLAVQHRCRTKTQFEVTFPLLYVFAQIDEDEIWTGFNADDHYLNTREYAFEQRRMRKSGMSPVDRKQAFDSVRRSKFQELISDPSSGDTWWFAKRVAEQQGKTMLDPYLDDDVQRYFLQFDYDQLSPLRKPIVREALAQQLQELPTGTVAVGVQMQTGAGVDVLFQTLLADMRINRFEERYTSVSALCLRWAREVAEHSDRFVAELKSLPPPIPATRVDLISRSFGPYLMRDVHAAAARSIAVAVEAFAGGGGSAVGLHLAGYCVAVANEFVAEAARTYCENFPETSVDQRDIREIIG